MRKQLFVNIMFLLFCGTCFLVILIIKIYSSLTKGRCLAKPYLNGKIAIITGGNSGIGYETAIDLASKGCKVIIADIANANETVENIIQQTGNNNVFYKYLDLGSLKSIREFSKNTLENESRLDILINNAGCGGFDDVYTDDGLLKIMQINYFGPFLLTHLLLDILKKSSRSRIIFISSILSFTHCISSVNDMNAKAKSTILRSLFQYGNSKFCTIIAAKGFADKLKKYQIQSFSVNPGTVKTTIFTKSYTNNKATFLGYILYYFLNLFVLLLGKTPEEGAQTTLHCALSDENNLVSGEFYTDCKIHMKPFGVYNEELCKKIWAESEKLCKLKNEEII